MSNVSSVEDAVSRFATQSDAIGRLAQDSGGFAAVVAAFESRDPGAFRWVLDRLGFLPQCELICDWVRIKLGVLRCIEVCGPPREKAETPSLQEFAHAVVQLASNEKLLRRVVDSVSCGDADAYRAAIEELRLQDFCYLICHWVYLIIYIRVCKIVCSPQPVLAADPASEIRAAGEVIARLIGHEKAFSAVGQAAAEQNCVTLKAAIAEAGLFSDCETICFLICTWRCVWVCRELCVFPSPVLGAADGVEEARNFALASRVLANQPRALGDLVSAAQRRDAKAYGEIVTRFGLGAYCRQLCAWLCSVTCRELCICVCPNQALEPWFTTVGSFNIYADINGATGLTNKSLPVTLSMPYGGGPNFAFFEQLTLGGNCPAYSPISPSTPMQYRFLYANASTSLSAAITAAQTSINVASSAGVPATPFNVSVCNSGATGETLTVTAVSGTTWTVTRGQAGTTAAAAGVGATVWINPTAIKENLMVPVPVGTRIISWPQNLAGIAGPTLVPTFQTVMVGPPPSGTPVDPTMPLPGNPYTFGDHYILPDADGWVAVDTTINGLEFTTLLGFDTTQVVVGGAPIAGAFGAPGGTPAGSAVPAANQGAGTNLSIIFEATRVGLTTVDYSNSLCKIHVNNWSEVNNLWFEEFDASTGCCTPIVESLSVQFTTDHEEMSAGAWSLSITSCSGSAPGDITPTVSSGTVTVSPRGGWGTIVEDTSTWTDCSYLVTLSTRPGLTTGSYDRTAASNWLTFCICGN